MGLSVGRLTKSIRKRARRWNLPRHVRAFHGSGPAPLGERDLVVAAVVRDVEVHVPSFLAHYRRLGARHVVLLDNGSVDGTVDAAVGHADVTVLACDLPYKDYKREFKAHLVDTYARGAWCLMADADERWDYPGSDTLALPDFLAYLNAGGYTAVVAHMLDLFAEGPHEGWPADGEALERECVWYDNSQNTTKPMLERRGVVVSDPAIRRTAGGVRRVVFGHSLGLTKSPLVFPSRGARVIDSHDCQDARLADVSTVLRHYRFDRGFFDACRRAVERGNYHDGSKAQAAALAALDADPRLSLKRDTARRWTGPDALVDEGFLVVSDAFRTWVAQHGRPI